MYVKVEKPAPRLKNGWRKNPRVKRSPVEEYFRRIFGDYPANENEIKQFLPYFNQTKVDNYFNRNS